MIVNDIDDFFSLPDVFQTVNAGGILEDIRVAPTAWVERIDLPLDSSVLADNAIVLKNNKYWVSLRAAHNTVEWTCTGEDTEHGEVFRNNMLFEMPKVRPSLLEWIKRYGNMNILVIAVDRNGYGRLLGTKTEAMRMRFAATSQGRKGKSKLNVEIFGNMLVPGYFISAMDETVAYISATQDTVSYTEKSFESILNRLLALENGLAWVNGSMFRVYTIDDSSRIDTEEAPQDNLQVFDLLSLSCTIKSLKKSDFLNRNIEVIGAYLNGLYLKSILSPLYRNDALYDCYIDIRDDDTIVNFSTERVHLNTYTNIFHLVIKVSA